MGGCQGRASDFHQLGWDLLAWVWRPPGQSRPPMGSSLILRPQPDLQGSSSLVPPSSEGGRCSLSPPPPPHTLCSNPAAQCLQGPPPVGRQAIHSIFKGLMDTKGVLTVEVGGALVMGQRLAPGSIGGCQEVGQPVDSH